MLKMFLNLFKKSMLRRKLDAYVHAKVSQQIAQEFNRHYYARRWEEAQLERVDKVLKRLEKDLVIYCHLDSNLAKSIYREQFENEEIQFVKKFLRPGDGFIDVGANIGLFTLHGAQRVGADGSVWAIEPTQGTFQRLVENIELNGFSQVRTWELALSNENATAKISVSTDGYDAWNSFGVPSSGQHYDYQEVQTARLDDLIQAERINAGDISLIKIDVEGWEVPVIEGAIDLLSGKVAPTLLIEFSEENARAAGFTCAELYTMVARMGYDWFEYDCKENRLIRHESKDRFAPMNLIATKDLEQVSKRLRNEL